MSAYQPVDIVAKIEAYGHQRGNESFGEVMRCTEMVYDWRDALVAEMERLAAEKMAESDAARECERWVSEAMADAYRHAAQLVRGER